MYRIRYTIEFVESAARPPHASIDVRDCYITRALYYSLVGLQLNT